MNLHRVALLLILLTPLLAFAEEPIYDAYSFSFHEHAAPAWSPWRLASSKNGGSCVMHCVDGSGVPEVPTRLCDELEPADPWIPVFPDEPVPNAPSCTDANYPNCARADSQLGQWTCTGHGNGHTEAQFGNAFSAELDGVAIVIHEYASGPLGVGRPPEAIDYVNNQLGGFQWPLDYTPADPNSEAEYALSWAADYTYRYPSFVAIRGQEMTGSGGQWGGLGQSILMCPNSVTEICDPTTDCYYTDGGTEEEQNAERWSSLIAWAHARDCLVVVAHPCINNSGTAAAHTFHDTLPGSEDVVIGMELNSSRLGDEVMCTGAGQSDGPNPGYLDSIIFADSWRGALATSDEHSGTIAKKGRTIVKIDRDLGLTEAGLWEALKARRFFALPSLSYRYSTNTPPGKPPYYFDPEKPIFDVSVCNAVMGERVERNGACPVDVTAVRTEMMGYIGGDDPEDPNDPYPWSVFDTWELWFGDYGSETVDLIATGSCASDADCSFQTTKPAANDDGKWVVIIREPAAYGGNPSMISSAIEVTPCAPDTDGDSICDAADNCPGTPNARQRDADGDGVGTACDVACDDGADNDGDGQIDHAGFDDAPADTSCADKYDTSEAGGCGMGFELLVFAPLLMWARRRRTRT